MAAIWRSTSTRRSAAARQGDNTAWAAGGRRSTVASAPSMSPSFDSFCARPSTASGLWPWVEPTWRIETMLDRAWRRRARKSALRPGSRAATAARPARVSNSSARPARVGAPSWARRARARRSDDRGSTRSRLASSSAKGRAVRAASARVAAARAAPAASRARCWPVSRTATRPSSWVTSSDADGETAVTLDAPRSGGLGAEGEGVGSLADCWRRAAPWLRENQVGPNRARAAPVATQTIPKAISAQKPGPSRRRRRYSVGSRGASESTGSGASVMRHSCPTRPRRAMFS
jgi:hypothetical protein